MSDQPAKYCIHGSYLLCYSDVNELRGYAQQNFVARGAGLCRLTRHQPSSPTRWAVDKVRCHKGLLKFLGKRGRREESDCEPTPLGGIGRIPGSSHNDAHVAGVLRLRLIFALWREDQSSLRMTKSQTSCAIAPFLSHTAASRFLTFGTTAVARSRLSNRPSWLWPDRVFRRR